MIVPQDAVEDDGVAVRPEGKVGRCEAVAVELGVLDKDGLVASDRVVCRHIQLPRRQVVDTFFNGFQEIRLSFFVSGG